MGFVKEKKDSYKDTTNLGIFNHQNEVTLQNQPVTGEWVVGTIYHRELIWFRLQCVQHLIFSE